MEGSGVEGGTNVERKPARNKVAKKREPMGNEVVRKGKRTWKEVTKKGEPNKGGGLKEGSNEERWQKLLLTTKKRHWTWKEVK